MRLKKQLVLVRLGKGKCVDDVANVRVLPAEINMNLAGIPVGI